MDLPVASKSAWYTPIPDIEDLLKRNIFNQVLDMSLLNGWEPQEFLQKYENYKQELSNVNTSFCPADEISVRGIVKEFQPKIIIECGHGQSSRILNEVKPQNSKFIIINPGEKEFSGDFDYIQSNVEYLEPTFFTQLQNNDILFIDTTHTLRTGGDVHYLYLKILPILNPGVIIHIHDIGLPYEYPETYFHQHLFWTEAYLLYAFLLFNDTFKILYPVSFLRHEGLLGSSFWIQKVK